MSKNLKRTKAIKKDLKLNGINAIAIHWPKTSSTTTSCGSRLFEDFKYSSTAKISNINKLEGEHEVYHLTRVSDNANFFANDFVVHNMQKR